MADLALCLAENIALLQKTCSTPIPPTRNAPNITVPQDDRVLNFDQELDIVSCFSYLSSYSDDPDRAMAMCVEERQDREGLTVVVATNTGSVEYLMQGVRSIRHVLEKQASDSRGDYVNALLTKVLEHGRARITRHLGLSGSRSSNTAALLKRVLKLAYRDPKTERPSSFDEISRLSTEFSRLSDSYEGTSVFERHGKDAKSMLLSIMMVAAQIHGTHQQTLQDMLKHIPNSQMNEDTKDSILTRLGCVGHYVPTAQNLLRHAQRLVIFRSIGVRSVYFGPVDLTSILQKSSSNSLGILDHYVQQSEKRHSLKTGLAMRNLPHWTKKKKGLKGLQKDIRNQVTHNDGTHSYKVHAEIQLLLYYELYTTNYRPRVIKPSKHACFLCDLFTKIHGQFYMPKSHGKMYELWMLPEIAKLGMGRKARQRWSSVVGSFNAAVEKVIWDVASGEKSRITDPKESEIFSLLSNSPPKAGGGTLAKDGSAAQRPPSSSKSVQDALASGKPAMGPVRLSVINEGDVADELMIELKHEPTFHLQPGSEQSYTFDGSQTSVRFHATKIHVQFSHEQAKSMAITDSKISREQIPPIRVTGRWLDPGQARAMEKLEGAVADLEKIWITMTPKNGALFSESGLLIRKGEQIMQFVAIYEGEGAGIA
ncbi:hypothetical protein P280DRAFT_438025 [Massarina eburnea CBS 473.64]|uniref:Uncharacterized protein n=1 Tax=Massarina eburnea CBS 473.64 TaxID=1395130 RepID=A0A6A6RKH3_9PLEO|nr:hypothetical protein P280DRAFT_438025 [Massarina eburnea CBS 473.64]